MPSLSWYARRLRAMSAAELAWRAHDEAVHLAWRRRQVLPGAPVAAPPRVGPALAGRLPADALAAAPADAVAAVVAAAGRIRSGHGELLGVPRSDLADPDWFLDPTSGRRAPDRRYAFAVDHRAEAVTGNVKQIWELSRLQHLTVVAAAYAATGDDGFADAAAAGLRSWWRANPFLSGVHWTSGIEVGLRLIAFTWIRRLLDPWPAVAGCFEDDDLARAQLWWHQHYLARLRSRGSSANNHVVAEAAGAVVAACGLPWFSESGHWAQRAGRLLEAELAANTFPDGLNREQASEYHGFVLELGLVAAAEAAAAGRPLTEATGRRLAAMADALAAVVDRCGRPPRQGDGDDGRALVLDDPGRPAAAVQLATAAAVVGPLAWWPAVADGVTSTLLGQLAPGRRVTDGRPARRPSHFPDAGLTLLRTPPGERPELWVRCDGGPQGFLSIAGHGHADALSVEVRHDGVDVLADPGTYCYHGEPAWRAYFRSTVGHCTMELDGVDQAESGGPFLWTSHADATAVEVGVGDDGEARWWAAEHHGYQRLHPPAVHRRRVELGPGATLRLHDQVSSDGPHRVRLALHLGPAVSAELDGPAASLSWSGPGGPGRCRVELPADLAWSAHRGGTDPVLGWYSPSFGVRGPATVLVGAGTSHPGCHDFFIVMRFN